MIHGSKSRAHTIKPVSKPLYLHRRSLTCPRAPTPLTGLLCQSYFSSPFPYRSSPYQGYAKLLLTEELPTTSLEHFLRPKSCSSEGLESEESVEAEEAGARGGRDEEGGDEGGGGER